MDMEKHFMENRKTGKKTKFDMWTDAVASKQNERNGGGNLRNTVIDDEVELL